MARNFWDALKQYLAENQPDYGDGDAHTILEMLFNCYHEFNGLDTQAIKDGFEEIYNQLSGRTVAEIDKIIYPVCTLCSEHQKTGFIEGVKVGLRLRDELFGIA